MYVSFRNTRGLKLAAELMVPAASPPYPAVAFAHGLRSDKKSPRNRAVAEGLAAAGIAALLFDFTGHGESEGFFEESTQSQQVEDLGAALDHLESQEATDASRLGVSGASTGAAVAVLRAADDRRIKALVLRSGRAEGALSAAQRVAVPTLLVVGAEDWPIVQENQELFVALRGEKKLELVPGAGHLFERSEQLQRAVELSVAWFVEKLAHA